MTAYAEPMKITSPTLHATIWFTMAVFVAILAMSFVFKVEVVAAGEGRVVPVSRVQVVQTEFPGQITAILVRNGDAVEQGDILLELDQTDAQADLGTITAEADRLVIEKARLEALTHGLIAASQSDVELDQVLMSFEVPERLRYHPFVKEQRRLLDAQFTDLQNDFAQIDARETANRRSEEVTNANISRVDAAVEIQAERFSIAQTLVEQGNTSRAAFLDTQQVLAELERERDVYLRELDQKIAERNALDTERQRIVAERRSAALDRMSQIDARLATLLEEQLAAERRLSAATLRAPASGIVDQLSVFTIGGIAEAGAELMRIVPTDADVEIEATFSNQDIGFMRIDQQANIGLHAYPSERFGFLTGRVRDIAADSTEIATNQWRFIVRVQPDETFLKTGGEQFTIRPGMTASINVTTDERRIISYFFAPIVDTIQDALGER
jgi:hemolysin D